MNDYFLDPPDWPDPPSCPSCEDGFADFDAMTQSGGKLHCVCDLCGHSWDLDVDPDPDPSWDGFPTDRDIEPLEIVDEPHCPHGNEWGNCDHCDYLSDIAYDAAREGRSR